MQSRKKTHPQGSLGKSTHCKGKKRTTPVWELRYRLPSGKQSDKVLGRVWDKQSRPPKGFLTENQAIAAMQAFLDENAESVPEDRITFGRACEDFIRFCEQEKNLRGSTVHEYRGIAKRLGRRPWRREGTWKERPLDSFTAEDLIGLRAEMIEAGLAPGTINQTRRVIRGAFGDRPIARVWKWKPVQIESDGKLRFYTPAQVALLKEHALTEEDRAMFTLAAEQGARASELCGLKILNVDFAAGIIRFEDGFTSKGGEGGTKGHATRSLPMTDNSRALLWPLCQRAPYNAAGERVRVFEEQGRAVNYDNFYRRFKKAIKAAGLPKITFHELRHTFGTQMMASGKVDIYTLQRLMGHADIKTTQIYLHYQPDPGLGDLMSGIWSQAPENVIPIRKVS